MAPKKERTRAEIFNLMDYLAKIHCPVGFHNHCLAWCSGEISDNEFMSSLEGFCMEHDVAFAMPLNEGIPDMKEIPST
jgi:hypothetical protein